MVKKCSEELRVPFVPCQLRHSGPSWDRLRNLRPLLEVQKRGMWASYAPVARYEKAARSLAECQRIDAPTRNFLE
eukprot:4979751-Lingulodinium_polyedra.AAC.1